MRRHGIVYPLRRSLWLLDKTMDYIGSRWWQWFGLRGAFAVAPVGCDNVLD